MNKNTQKSTNLQQPKPTPQLQSLPLSQLETIASGTTTPCPDCPN